MKTTALAHPMQALIKYHGLRNWKLRIPYHDSISVNLEALWTQTTVEFGDFSEDSIVLGGEEVRGRALERVLTVVNRVRRLAKIGDKVKIISENSIKYTEAKGLGFSSSGGAALAAALFKSANLDEKYGWDLKFVSRIARLHSGSASRSVVGGYALWHAGYNDETSFGENISGEKDLDMGIVVVPLPSEIKTEEAHFDVTTSPFFKARIKSASKRVKEMIGAINARDLEEVARLAEIDSLELHALTMTGRQGLLAYRPESIQVMGEIRKMRQEGVPAYFSMQTGPSVFVNTYPENLSEVRRRIESLGFKTISSRIGGEVKII